MIVESVQVKCVRCEHEWFPRKRDVRKCPRCQSVLWDTPREVVALQDAIEKRNSKALREMLTPPPKPKPKPSIYLDLFDEFWAQYPRKVAKQPALNAWKRTVKNEQQADAIMKALAVQKICPQWTKDGGAFIPHPATWLNQHRWEDEVIPGQPMERLEPCTARVRNQDGTRYIPCGKPSIRKQGMGFLCVECDKEYQDRKAKMEGQP